jgi:hypothetical protein
MLQAAFSSPYIYERQYNLNNSRKFHLVLHIVKKKHAWYKSTLYDTAAYSSLYSRGVFLSTCPADMLYILLGT